MPNTDSNGQEISSIWKKKLKNGRRQKTDLGGKVRSRIALFKQSTLSVFCSTKVTHPVGLPSAQAHSAGAGAMLNAWKSCVGDRISTDLGPSPARDFVIDANRV